MHTNNKGYEVEKRMKKWFKGESHKLDCVDFCTKTSLYEVKSCNLLNGIINNNHKRKYVIKKHKRIGCVHLGRFTIKVENHIMLKAISEEEGKIAKYVFVIQLEKQKVWKVKSWEEIDRLVDRNKKSIKIRIRDIFSWYS